MMKTMFATAVVTMSFSIAHAGCGSLNGEKLMKDINSVEKLFNGVIHRTPHDSQADMQNQLSQDSANLVVTGQEAQEALGCYEARGIIVSYDQAALEQEVADINQIAQLREKIVVRDTALIGSDREDVLNASIKAIQITRKTLAKIKYAKISE
jgi:hypothetical protein